MRTETFLTTIAAEAHTHPAFVSPRRVVAELGLRHDDHVLELATGRGHFARELVRVVGPRGRVYLRGESTEVLAGVCRELVGAGHVHVCMLPHTALEQLADIDTETLDAVLAVNLSPHEDVFAEAGRMLRRGGTLCVIDWHGDMSTGLQYDTAVDRARACGFIPSRDMPMNALGRYHYGILFTRT